MADITIMQPHHCAEVTAVSRAHVIVDDLVNTYRGQIESVVWDDTDQRVQVTGKLFDISLAVDATSVTVDVTLKGFVAKLAKGQITRAIEVTLSKAYAD